MSRGHPRRFCRCPTKVASAKKLGAQDSRKVSEMKEKKKRRNVSTTCSKKQDIVNLFKVTADFLAFGTPKTYLFLGTFFFWNSLAHIFPSKLRDETFLSVLHYWNSGKIERAIMIASRLSIVRSLPCSSTDTPDRSSLGSRGSHWSCLRRTTGSGSPVRDSDPRSCSMHMQETGVSREAYADKHFSSVLFSCARLFSSTREKKSGRRWENPSTLLDATFEFRQRQRRPFSSRYPR